jgi:predicted glycoside hydrolase/deacetylase ChbG (UPF0249 family)
MTCKIVADDYGMSKEINHAISELVRKDIISKVSVMANESIEYSINDIGENVEVGLHLNLTANTKIIGINQDKKISFFKLLYFIYTKQLNVDQIVNNIRHQHEFLRYRGFKISYLDTHHHIHIIPQVLEALIIYAKTEGITSIRCITMEKKYLFFYLYSLTRFRFFAQVPKMIFLYSMGTLMKPKLDRAQINYCKNLVLMPLAIGGDYTKLLRELLNKFKNKNVEIVVHPGLEVKTNKSDSYSTGRYIEYYTILNQESLLKEYLNI